MDFFCGGWGFCGVGFFVGSRKWWWRCGGYIYYIGGVKFSILGNKISILQKKIPSIEIFFCSIGIFGGWDVRFCR